MKTFADFRLIASARLTTAVCSSKEQTKSLTIRQCLAVAMHVGHNAVFVLHVQCESKKSPLRFLKIFPKRLGIFNQFLHTYYMILSTLD